MRIPIVNENDKIIGYKDRKDRNSTDIVRLSAVWVTDTEGRILLAMRALNKIHAPGKWGPAAAGTVEEGENYEDNAYKELEEEIGVTGILLRESKKFFRESNGTRKFIQLFLGKVPIGQKLIPEEEEIEQLKWFSKEEFLDFYKKNSNDFVDFTGDVVNLLYQYDV